MKARGAITMAMECCLLSQITFGWDDYRMNSECRMQITKLGGSKENVPIQTNKKTQLHRLLTIRCTQRNDSIPLWNEIWDCRHHRNFVDRSVLKEVAYQRLACWKEMGVRQYKNPGFPFLNVHKQSNRIESNAIHSLRNMIGFCPTTLANPTIPVKKATNETFEIIPIGGYRRLQYLTIANDHLLQKYNGSSGKGLIPPAWDYFVFSIAIQQRGAYDWDNQARREKVCAKSFLFGSQGVWSMKSKLYGQDWHLIWFQSISSNLSAIKKSKSDIIRWGFSGQKCHSSVWGCKKTQKGKQKRCTHVKILSRLVVAIGNEEFCNSILPQKDLLLKI